MKKYNNLLNWLFPLRCPVCDDIVYPIGTKICPECKKSLKIIQSPTCQKCGKEIKNETDEHCYDCSTKKHYYTKGIALYNYQCISDSLYRFKYLGRAEYAGFYVQELVKNLGNEIKSWNADGIIPVPLHGKRMRKRGYNQAQLIAAGLSRQLGIPIYDKLIERNKNTIPQKRLNHAERQNNLKKAFKICQNDVKLKSIIIVDDIYTTGSTIDAITKELKRVHVDRVYFITLAIGNGL